MSAPEPYWSDPDVTLYLGKCETVLPGLPANSVDAIVTDPPAGIGFMDKEWDDFRRARNTADADRDNVFGRTSAHGPEYGRRDRGAFVEMLTVAMSEALRVLKPGGHALVWAIPRTSGWTQWALEDAGFEIRDCISHLFGSGMPKGLNVSKAIDKAAGAEREVVGARAMGRRESVTDLGVMNDDSWQGGAARTVTAPATEDAARWDGWNVALKPGQEMWWLARKPFKSSVAANILEHGTGALNIAACRVDPGSPVPGGGGLLGGAATRHEGWRRDAHLDGEKSPPHDAGRWPTNILLTHSAACEVIGTRHLPGDSRSGQEPGDRPAGFGDVGADSGSGRPNGPLYGDQAVEVYRCAPDCPVGELDRQSGVRQSGDAPRVRNSDKLRDAYGEFTGQHECPPGREANSGGASRFYPTFRYQAKAPAHERPRLADGTAHPTVKPLELMRWLARLITPPGGTVLDLFAGTGPTAEACIVEGFLCVLIEKDPVSAELIRTRLRKDIQPDMFGGIAS